MASPRHGEGDRPKGGGGGGEQISEPPPSVADATATSPSRGGLKRIALAAVAGAHGVKGELRLKLFTDNAENLKRYETVHVGGVERKLESVRPAPSGAVVRLSGINDRSGAESLRGSLVEVDRSALPPLGDGEYYHADLIGLACVDRQGGEAGKVVAVENYGAGDLLEVETGTGKRSLIPFKPGIAEMDGDRIVLDPEFLA